VCAVNCLYADYDAKDWPGGKEAILQHLLALPWPPTVIIDSGGGYHVYHLAVSPCCNTLGC
jgi:hypothetical protein